MVLLQMKLPRLSMNISMISNIKKFLLISDFAKSAINLSFKSLIAQIIPLLLYPLLTKIYTPEEFGIGATLLSIVPILSVLSTGGYENAILISSNNNEANNVVKFILIRSFIVLIFFEIFLFFFKGNLFNFFEGYNYENLFYLIPILGFAASISIIFNELLIYNASFKALGNNKIINSTSTSIPKLFTKNFILFGNGIFLGEFIGKCSFAIYNLFKIYRYNNRIFSYFSFKEFKLIWVKYFDFQKFSMPDQLISNFGGAAPFLILSIYFAEKDLGYFSIASSLLTAPISVFTLSIRDVFRQKANKEFKLSGQCSHTYKVIFKIVFFSGLIGFLLMGISLPFLIDVVFGDSWKTITKYSLIQLPMFFFSFVSMSLSGVFAIVNKVKFSLFWQLYYTMTTILGLFVSIFIFDNFEYSLYCLVFVRCSAYILYSYMSYDAAKGR